MSALTERNDTVRRVVPTARWPTKRLGEITEPGVPALYGILQPGPDTPEGVPYVRPTEITEDVIQLNETRRTSLEIAEKYKRSMLKAEDIVLSIVGTIGKVALVPPELEGGNITQSSIRIRPRRDVALPRFLAWFLRSPVATRQYDAARLGTAVPRLNVAHVRDLVIPTPPLSEQRRIVAGIEKQFTRLDAGIAALRRTQANLKRYRAAVLKAAIGADDSPRVALVELVEPGAKVLYGILQPGPETPHGVPYVRPTEINLDKIQLAEIRKTSREIAAKYTRSTLRTGDIILSIVGTIGKVATVPAELDGGNITQSSVRIRPDCTKVRGDYLAWVLRSPFAVKQYDTARLGTAVPRLNVAHVRDLQIPNPPLAEQTQIVAEVERRLSVVEELVTVVNANLQRATRLRQSILQKAFTGEP